MLFFGKNIFTDSVTKRGYNTTSFASICPNEIYIYFRSSLTNDSYCFWPNSIFLIVFVKFWSEIFLVSSAWTSAALFFHIWILVLFCFIHHCFILLSKCFMYPTDFLMMTIVRDCIALSRISCDDWNSLITLYWEWWSFIFKL